MADWTDRIVGDRMTVDREFNERIVASDFSSQEWGLIMTATEFDIEHAEDPDRARIVADTEKLPQIMPEVDKLKDQMPAAGGAGGQKSGGSVFGSIKDALGLGNGGADKERLESAERLVQEYAEQLQAHLESQGKWDSVRERYQESE